MSTPYRRNNIQQVVYMFQKLGKTNGMAGGNGIGGLGRGGHVDERPQGPFSACTSWPSFVTSSGKPTSVNYW